MKIYLATPYSHNDPTVRLQRFETINKIAADILRLGFHVYSPISHTHPIAMVAGDLPNTWEFWEQYDIEFLKWADQLWVYMADGWKESKGVQAEIRLAMMMGKPVFFMDPVAWQKQMDQWAIDKALVKHERTAIGTEAPACSSGTIA